MANMELLRLKQVLEIVPASRATIWRWTRDGKFPKPIKLSERCTAWKKSDIESWIDERAAA
ncbi:helix-turn-helix transcriptional regulator [Candidatus Venteria ishoeyi]|uniref:Prophage CP4-57 regulatory protein (AlpA) n=1 Tax=Candidatus Venteria ishoeyi TaxID=1899563 RepID=A0A1H6FC13_9GAMM|nr:AlpA family phage regulatory protein [Candidatus Venteria ishoeyi]MDM8545168.1 AlpA family phage regulatory protein [Candidatus Venteria ishoeyi]SEH06686.1 Prophage CP4-57 regulatory protein (AlpA) [Candidatus Venteria ishoeyi]